MNDVIAYCGIICSNCDVYKATINNDEFLRLELVKKYTTDSHVPNVEDFYCKGCFDIKGEGCEVRQCATSKTLINCAQCDSYNCEKILNHFNNNQNSKKILDELYDAMKQPNK